MLVLPTNTYRASPFLAAAGRIGIDLVIASNEASSLGALMAERYLTLDLGRPDQSAERAAAFVRHRPVEAVVGVDETAVVTAAHVAARLGLRHSPVAAVDATRDKRRLRACLAAAGVTQPAFAEITSDAGAAAREAAIALVGLPCVVKPVNLAGSQGVIRADDDAGLAAAIQRTARLLGTDPAPLLVESFIAGAEVAVEGLLTGGRLEVITIFDKPDPLEGPFFEETLYVTPSRLPAASQTGIRTLTARAVEAVGLTEGPIHAEVRLGADGPCLIEVAARSIGGLCSRVLRFRSGATLEEVILSHAAGLPPPDLGLEDRAGGVLMIPIRRRGTLVGIGGLAEAGAIDGIDGIVITIPPGEPVVPLPEGDRYLGFGFAHAATADEVEEALRSFLGRLTIDIRPG